MSSKKVAKKGSASQTSAIGEAEIIELYNQLYDPDDPEVISMVNNSHR